MDNLPELHISIGVEDSGNYEYKEQGFVIFYIPHYKVKVNLKRGSNKNVSPTFDCHQELIHLPIERGK